MGCFTSKEEQRTPTAARGCTDIFWLSIYIVFWCIMIVVAAFSFVYGNPLRIINGYDTFGNTCGVKSNEKYVNFPLSGKNTADKPYLLIMDIKNIRRSLKICVKECPSKTIYDKFELHRYYQDTGTSYCRYDFDMNNLLGPEKSGFEFFNMNGPCPELPIYKGESILHRCIPTEKNTPLNIVGNAVDQLNSWDTTQKLLSDLYTTYPIMIIMAIVAFCISIILIAMMHYLTKLISWLICIFVAVASVAITIILWWTYYKLKHDEEVKFNNAILDQFIRNETAIYVLAIIATIIMIFILVIVWFLKSKLTGLAALFEEAGKCMLSLPGLSGPPILAFIATCLYLIFWVAVVICLVTASYPGQKSLIGEFERAPERDFINSTATKKFSTDVDYKSLAGVEYQNVNWLQGMLWFYFIGLIWTCEFIFACQQLSIAAAVAFWYFRKPTDSPVASAILKLLKYHLGSAVKGSLLITMFKVPRLILTYIYTKLKLLEEKGNECATCGLKCCICCFWFLEKFIRYLNHNAYTVIAIESINFCPAAGIAWNAMASNPLQVATINGIGDFILFLGKLAIAGVCGLISILILRDRPDVYFYVAPVILITLFAFFIAHIILSLYEIVVDTLFLCVCEDKTINGNNGRWKESNLAHLIGEEPNKMDDEVTDYVAQRMEMTPIERQPFKSGHLPAVQ